MPDKPTDPNPLHEQARQVQEKLKRLLKEINELLAKANRVEKDKPGDSPEQETP